MMEQGPSHIVQNHQLDKSACSDLPMLVLRENFYGDWELCAGNVSIAEIYWFEDFITGWMSHDPLRLKVEPYESS